MKDVCERHWREEYLPQLPDLPPQAKRSFLDSFLYKPKTAHNFSEFDSYINSERVVLETSSDINLFQWWWDHKKEYPTLYQDALDTLSIPAMATECERVFSSAKKLLTPDRNALKDDIIEATECLKAWWKDELIKQLD